MGDLIIESFGSIPMKDINFNAFSSKYIHTLRLKGLRTAVPCSTSTTKDHHIYDIKKTGSLRRIWIPLKV